MMVYILSALAAGVFIGYGLSNQSNKNIARRKIETVAEKQLKPRVQALEMAIDALEKQLAKAPYIEGDGYADGEVVYDTWICPRCEATYEIDYDIYDYCPKCGQHIDRSEINDEQR